MGMRDIQGVLSRGIILSVLILQLLLLASAERIEYCDSIPEDFVDWNKSVSLPKFDPAMGTLKSVDLLMTTNLSQEIMIENTSTLAGNLTSSLTGALIADLPSSDSVSIDINSSSGANLSAYNGTLDLGGDSGFRSVFQIPTEAASKSISNIEDFLAGAPGESIAIPVRANIVSQTKMPGSSSSQVITKAGAEVCVSYTYDAKAEEGGSQ